MSAGNPYGKKNQDFIGLAVKCRLLSIDQEKELLTLLAQKRQDTPDYSADTLFRETQALSSEHLDFLYAVKEHLKMKMLDKKFGELGVANQFVQPENVKKALDIQSNLFKETNQSKLIGDILLENKEISRADKAAILLSQDRVKDELLSEAMNDIATTEIEKLSMNMRFGAIAVKKELITIEQLNRALAHQESQKESGNSRSHLGDVLKQLYDLPDKTLLYILNIQKELEKKRLSLEKALIRYNSETSINRRISSLFDYRFSKNKLKAFITRTGESFEQIRAKDFTAWLNSLGINWGICPVETMNDFLNQGKKGEEICIAQGLQPEKGKDDRVEFFFDTQFIPGNAEKDSDLAPLVKKGEALARFFPGKEGRAGRDISGFSLAPPPSESLVIHCGEGVVRAEELFIADSDGMARLYKGRTLFVRPLQNPVITRNHTGDIASDTGDEYKDANLRLEGSILPKGKVRCQNLEVSGDLLGEASAAGNVRVKGGIGKQPPTGQEGSQAMLKAQGEVIAGKTIANAVIATGRSLTAPNADLTGSTVQAFQDIMVKNIISRGGSPSILQTGKSPNLKLDRINGLIKEQSRELSQIKFTREKEELKGWLEKKLQAREEYHIQHQILKFFLALEKEKALSDQPSLGEKLALFEKNPNAYPNLPEAPPWKKKAAAEFRTHILKETAPLVPRLRKNHLQELIGIKYGMYRAAVSAARRYTHEYETRKRKLDNRVAPRRKIIAQKEAAIKKLIIRKDSLLLGQEYSPPPVAPTIKVKNLVQKGTSIKGVKSSLTIEQDIYGVKFTEIPGGNGKPAEITITGLYE